MAYIGLKSRTERPRKTKIGTEVAHVTPDADTTFKVKRSKVKVAKPLWLVVLAGQHGHTVMVTYPCVHDVYRVTTCRPGRGHIIAAARLQLAKSAAPSGSSGFSRSCWGILVQILPKASNLVQIFLIPYLFDFLRAPRNLTPGVAILGKSNRAANLLSVKLFFNNQQG